jgi:acetylornithine deacetylase/succinyl-diaminopimelate desuccinylase-like protein
MGVRPALVRTGGTLPIAAALSERGIPTIITGFSLPDANIHSPNERLRTEYLPLGIAAARALFEELAGL